MTNDNRPYTTQAAEYWRLDKPLEAGRVIFGSLPEVARVKWSSKILEAAVMRSGVNAPAIDRILHIAQHPTEWNQAHNASSSAGRLILELNKLKDRSTGQTLEMFNLALAVIVARLIYNATNPHDPFDEDTGWWIALTLKRILDFLNDEEFSKQMWLRLCFKT